MYFKKKRYMYKYICIKYIYIYIFIYKMQLKIKYIIIASSYVLHKIIYKEYILIVLNIAGRMRQDFLW